MLGRWTMTIFGIVISVIGILWILQGFDALGQNGGMNGNRNWSWIGIVVLLAGLALIGYVNRRARRPPPGVDERRDEQ